ncbi:MAG: hypothetical protein HUK14_10510 [Muribaculaceae bacterium]|nr:hypothetical protein [Muribaculaceae bacterium]
MLEFFLGAATGLVGGIAVKDKLIPSSKEEQLKTAVNNLTEQNNSLKMKCSEVEKRLTDSKREIESLKSKVRSYEDKGEDADDAIFDLKKANKKLLAEKEALATELSDYKSLLTAKMQEVDDLKDKILQLTNK